MGGTIRQETRTEDRRVRSILFFALRFLALMALGLFIWWQVMDSYVLGAGWAAQWPLRALGVQIEKVELLGKAHPMNQGERDPTIGIMYIMKNGMAQAIGDLQRFYMNLPTFIALVLATWPMTWRRRLFALLVGSVVLVFVHIAYLVVMFFWHDAIIANMEDAVRIQMAVMTTVPFLLWALLAYGDRIREILGGSADEPD
jgi:hypothetical protein